MRIRNLILTLFFCLFAPPAFAALGLDGAVSVSGPTSNSIAATLTTASANDVIIIYEGNGTNTGAATSISDTAGLSWHKRTSVIYNTSTAIIEEYYAVAPGALSGDIITVSWASTSSARVTAFGISGANTSSIFDGSGALPATTGTGSTVSVSTSNANDMLIGYCSATASPTPPAGWTQIVATGSAAEAAYHIVSSTQSGFSAVFGSNGSTSGTIADAVQQAGTGAPKQDIFFQSAP